MSRFRVQETNSMRNSKVARHDVFRLSARKAGFALKPASSWSENVSKVQKNDLPTELLQGLNKSWNTN